MNRADITVHGSDGQLQLVVEVKTKLDATLEWASQLHRNLLVHSMVPDSPFFLLALPDAFYFWKGAEPLSKGAPPDFWAPLSALVATRGEMVPSPDALSEQGLQLLVVDWLEELIHSDVNEPRNAPTQWLLQSGLLSAIRGGSVRNEVLV